MRILLDYTKGLMQINSFNFAVKKLLRIAVDTGKWSIIDILME